MNLVDRDSSGPEDLEEPYEADTAHRVLDVPEETEQPPADHIRTVAMWLLAIFGGCMGLILILTFLVAMWRQPALKDLIGFFGTIVATLGTLLGGVTAFYFARR